MTRFIVATFLFLAVAFYEMSGGAGFVPEQRIAVAETVETVTRADTAELSDLTQIQPATAALSEPLIVPPVIAETTDQAAIAAVVAEVAQAPVVTPAVLDLRQVIAERVNMREGPGTDYAVMDRLVQGTQTEVLETDPTGWTRVRVLGSGLSGWVSAEFLGASNG